MLIDDLKREVLAAMKAKDAPRRDILKVALGDVQMGELRNGKPLTDEQTIAIIKKIVKGNEETLQAAIDDATRKQLNYEISVLSEMLPKTLSVEDIITALTSVQDNIASASNDGMAMGVAMKHLKSQGASVEGKDVAAAVKTIRTA